ncbi:uncharacterized protein [Clytia hemisphaerica]|uniref:uncharacterized protein n=1 Tax=Clytia hemisphaerica TaxID=252671 RepID=UPI0034D4E31B
MASQQGKLVHILIILAVLSFLDGKTLQKKGLLSQLTKDVSTLKDLVADLKNEELKDGEADHYTVGDEGDDIIYSSKTSSFKRGVGATIRLWKTSDGRVEVPYIIAINDEAFHERIKRQVIRMNNAINCNGGKWRPMRSDDKHYIKFVLDSPEYGGCGSYRGIEYHAQDPAGKTFQPVYLNSQCGKHEGVILHEMMHAWDSVTNTQEVTEMSMSELISTIYEEEKMIQIMQSYKV